MRALLVFLISAPLWAQWPVNPGIGGAGGSSSAFSAITSGTNTTATMHVGTGATLDATGTGVINATTAGAAANLAGGGAGSVPLQSAASATGFVAAYAPGGSEADDAALVDSSVAGAYSSTSKKHAPALSMANMTGLLAAQVPAVSLIPGTGGALSGPQEFYVCTTTCTVTPPVPAAGYQFCVRNGPGVATVITLAAVATVYYEKTDFTAYGTVATAATSSGAIGDKICIVGLDATHYLTYSYQGTWTVN